MLKDDFNYRDGRVNAINAALGLEVTGSTPAHRVQQFQ
jgi:hypothetical protein